MMMHNYSGYSKVTDCEHLRKRIMSLTDYEIDLIW